MPSGIVGPFNVASVSYADAGNELASFKIFGTALLEDGSNFEAQRALWETVVTTASALVLGAKTRETYGVTNDFLWSQPTNGAARELALLCKLRDTITGFKMTARLGTLNPTAVHYVINTEAKDVVLLTEPTAVVNFVAAVNAFAINPYTGNAAHITGLRVVRGGK